MNSSWRVYEYLYVLAQSLLICIAHEANSLSLDFPWEVFVPVSCMLMVGQMFSKTAADEIENAKNT